MTPRELANEHSRKHNARTTGGDGDAPKKIRELQDRIKRLEEALKCLTLVVGLTPIAGNKDALQEAMDIAISELQAKEAK